MMFRICTIIFLLQVTVLESLAGKINIAYLHPVPYSEYHPPQTQLIIRFHDLKPEELNNPESFLHITGNRSGSVEGTPVISSDGRTIIFNPDRSFIPGEIVTVHLRPEVRDDPMFFLDTMYTFSISSSIDTELPKSQTDEAVDVLPAFEDANPIILNGVSIPSNFPRVKITTNDNPDSGLIFINNWGSPYFMMILDNSGNPLWYQQVSDRRRDFKLQKDGRLTMLIRSGYGGGSHIALDSTYTVVDTFFYPAGYSIDEHELQVLPNGHYFLIVADRQRIDMSKLVEGGNPSATVLGNHVAEMDANDNCILIWRSWDHFNITDAIHEDLTAAFIDYVHMNAIEIDHDDQLLISSRFQNEVSKIDRETGEFIWRLGGVNNQFEWVNDDNHLAYQHDIRVLSNGHYTVFDNGNRRSPIFSRGLEFAVDTVAMTVTKIWEFREDPDIYAKYMGNTQRLPNGNTLINWAVSDAPKLTEVRPDGSKAFEMDFLKSYECYRVFRFPWKGKAAVPYLLAESREDHITLIFNKFGDPNVTGYNIYGGLQPASGQIIATATRPYIHLFNLPGPQYYYFRVTAIDDKQQESGFSNEIKTYVQTTPAGQNMVINGDFSIGFEFWEWKVDTLLAAATWHIDSTEILQINITDGGNNSNTIQLSYPNLRLVNGYSYLFEFDAYASGGRVFEAEVARRDEPYESYSKIGYTWLTEKKQHFTFPFVMKDPTDYLANIIFRAGNSTDDIYIDNVSLKEVATNIDHKDPLIASDYALYPNYPNPFNPFTTIRFSVPNTSHTTLTVYNLLGEQIKTLTNRIYPAGNYQLRFDASALSSGIYVCKMYAREINGQRLFSKTQKLILIR